MNDATITALVQVGALATQAVLEYLRSPPRDEAEARARDAATLALMDQARAIGAALRQELSSPGSSRGSPGGPLVGATPAALDALRASAAHAGALADRIEARLPADPADPARVLAATIWGEARSEPLAGRIAVAHVVRNRAADPGWWGRDIVSVCLAPAQFTCWHDDQGQAVATVDEADPLFPSCLQIARGVLDGALADPTADPTGPGHGGADHYHRDDVAPAWAAGRSPLCAIGRHVFYRLGRDGAAPQRGDLG